MKIFTTKNTARLMAALMLATTLVPSGVMAQTSSQAAQDSPQAAVAQSADTESDTEAGDSQQETCPLPTFTINTAAGVSGTYSSSATVDITIGLTGLGRLYKSGYTVYYTTDGTEPEDSVTGSTKKAGTTGRISVKTTDASKRDTVTIKAIAVRDGYTNSQIAETSLIFESEDTAFFQDASLKKAICEALNKTYSAGASITKTEMETLTSLNLSKKDITDLTGLDAAVNVTELDLSGNPLGYSNTSYKAIGSLAKLETLNLSDCQIGGVTNKGDVGKDGVTLELTQSLLACENLRHLDLSSNAIGGSLSFLQNAFTGIKTLDLSDNYINVLGLNGEYKALEKVDMSNNCYYYDESTAGFGSLVNIGIDKFDFSDQKNLAGLYSVLRASNTITSSNFRSSVITPIKEDAEVIDLGEIPEKDLSFAFVPYGGYQKVKVTIGQETKQAMYFGYSNGLSNDIEPFDFENLENGQQQATLTLKHLNGDTKTYTLKWTTVDVATDDSEESAGITDAALQKLICKELGQDWKSYVVTKEDMASLKTTSITLDGASNLNGLQYATGLKTLTIRDGKYTSVPDLSGLTELTSLTILGSRCHTVDPGFASLPNLTSLTLGLGKVKALPDLSGLTKLTTLNIGTNLGGYNIDSTELTALPKVPSSLKKILIFFSEGNTCKLSALPENLKDTALTSLQVIRAYNLKDYSPLNGLKTSVALSLREVSGVEGLVNNESVKTLSFTNCTDLSMAQNMSFQNLTSATFNNCGLTSIPKCVLTAKDTLTTLNLTKNSFTTVPADVEQLTNLKNLTVSYCPLQSFECDFSKLENLTSFDMQWCHSSVWPSAVTKAPNLTSLNLYRNKISKVGEDIKNLTKLTSLNLMENYLLEYPEEVKSLTNLKTLNLDGNGYTDIPQDAFDGMTALTQVNLGSVMKAESNTVPASGSNAEKAITALKASNPNAKVYMTGKLYEALKSVTTSL